MPLTLNQFLFLVITFVIVIASTFLIILFIQLRKTASEGERTLAEIRELARGLKELDQKVKMKIDDLAGIINASKKTAVNVSEAAFFLTSKIIKPSSKYLPLLLPLARFFWRRVKKRKEKNNV